MEIKKYTNENYDILLKWFAQYEWSAFPKKSISPNSFIVYNNNIPVAFSSVYFCQGTDMAMLGFTVADKYEDKNVRTECIDSLIRHIERHTKECGYSYIQYHTDANPMVGRLENKHGYLVTDRGTAFILAKSLDGTDLGFLDE